MDIRLVQPGDAVKLSEYYRTNEVHFCHWSPLREDEYNAIDEWEVRLQSFLFEQEEKNSAYFIAYDESIGAIIGHCSLTNIVHGAFMACYMGYGVAESHLRQGIAAHLCDIALTYAFNDLKLHRIMANYMPHNVPSAALLKKLGFTIEGLAKQYLNINGRWEDHVLTSRINTNDNVL